MSPQTAAALRDRGGNLYVWLDGASMLHVRATPPQSAITFDTIYADGLLVHVDHEIEPPTRWVIERKRLPRLHFEARYDPPEESEHYEREGILGKLINAIFNEGVWP